MTTIYTPAQRKAIARAFKAAKPYLWDGESPLYSGAIIVSSIGLAIEYAWLAKRTTAKASELARQVIAERLYPYDNLASWLRYEGVPLEDLTNERLQKHRHEWLDMLIAEFSTIHKVRL